MLRARTVTWPTVVPSHWRGNAASSVSTEQLAAGCFTTDLDCAAIAGATAALRANAASSGRFGVLKRRSSDLPQMARTSRSSVFREIVLELPRRHLRDVLDRKSVV